MAQGVVSLVSSTNSTPIAKYAIKKCAEIRRCLKKPSNSKLVCLEVREE